MIKSKDVRHSLQVCRTITVAFNCQNALEFFKYNFLDFFESYGEAYDYYHKLEGNIYYFAKLKGKKGILVTFEIGTDIVVSSASNTTKNFIVDELKLYLDSLKMNNIRKYTIISIYVLGIIFLFLAASEFWIPVEGCKFYYKLHNKLFLKVTVTFLIGIYSFVFYKVIKGDLTIGIVIIVPALFAVYSQRSSRYLTNYRINNNLSIVKKGVITKKSQQGIGSTIIFKYKENEKENHRTLSVIHYDVTKLSINDTILFVYVEKCKYIAKIYKYKPTKAELEKCKNDCYLINGKLIPIDEYNNSKTKELD